MSGDEAEVAAHYGRAEIVDAILGAFRAARADPGDLTLDALAGVDEFHLGGRVATEALLPSFDLGPEDHALDVGSGIGGPARFFAAATGCRVTGVDLTREFVDAANRLSDLLGVADRTSFRVGSALDLPFDSGAFDAVTMIHVGMNIADKAALAVELSRVMRSGATLVVYDVMRTGPGELTYPVPWAMDERLSFLSSEEDYRRSLEAAGVAVVTAIDRRAMVLDAIETARRSPPIVNLRHLISDRWPLMFGNVVAALEEGTVSPIQLVATKNI